MAKAFTKRQRRFWRGPNLYIIRDKWVRDPSRTFGIRLVTCEYAVRNPNGSKKWLPCVEGVEFSAIAPLRTRAHG